MEPIRQNQAMEKEKLRQVLSMAESALRDAGHKVIADALVRQFAAFEKANYEALELPIRRE